MTANFNDIRAGIAAILSADTDLSESDQVFQYEPPIDTITADPFAVVVAAESEGEFETTYENKRIYGFTIRVFVERKNRGAGEAETLLTSIIDRLTQAFDQNYTLGVSGVLFTRATPSNWLYVIAEKEYRLAEIKLSTICSVDVTP
jgi:hypothetical protein